MKKRVQRKAPAVRRRIGPRKKPNPPRETKIYDRVLYVVAVKGPGHQCDAACVRARHTYKHDFTSKVGVYGQPDGTLVIR